MKNGQGNVFPLGEDKRWGPDDSMNFASAAADAIFSNKKTSRWLVFLFENFVVEWCFYPPMIFT
ncbi:MAG: hypothetical protein KBF42_07630, partial [Chitinophagales bacterium]|nr:hypothetical protein [Chitinophagales bacterium]MBP9797441.1 hypothetical protein [Chitinophagales bacterium]